jgi:steroid delta-isomerase-like uncharacterized protein
MTGTRSLGGRAWGWLAALILVALAGAAYDAWWLPLAMAPAATDELSRAAEVGWWARVLLTAVTACFASVHLLSTRRGRGAGEAGGAPPAVAALVAMACVPVLVALAVVPSLSLPPARVVYSQRAPEARAMPTPVAGPSEGDAPEAGVPGTGVVAPDAPAAGQPLPSEEHKALVRRLIEAMNAGDAAALDRLVAPEFVHRNPADPDLPPGPEGLRQIAERRRQAFPDGQDHIETQVAEGDTVVTRWSFEGTHQGELFGVAPTGKVVTMSGISIDRIADGRLVERWDEADVLGLLAQLEAGQA